jgi:hypothetical protein
MGMCLVHIDKPPSHVIIITASAKVNVLVVGSGAREHAIAWYGLTRFILFSSYLFRTPD